MFPVMAVAMTAGDEETCEYGGWRYTGTTWMCFADIVGRGFGYTLGTSSAMASWCTRWSEE